MPRNIYTESRKLWSRKKDLLSGLDIVLSPESFDPSCSIHELLLTREKRMAGGTNFNMGERGC